MSWDPSFEGLIFSNSGRTPLPKTANGVPQKSYFSVASTFSLAVIPSNDTCVTFNPRLLN